MTSVPPLVLAPPMVHVTPALSVPAREAAVMDHVLWDLEYAVSKNSVFVL